MTFNTNYTLYELLKIARKIHEGDKYFKLTRNMIEEIELGRRKLTK